MSGCCNCNRNSCGCSRNIERNEGCNRQASTCSRNTCSGNAMPFSGCGNNFQTYDNASEAFSNGSNVGPHTWNGYVWYDVEVEFSGPFYSSNNCGCNRGCSRGCSRGCGCN